MTSEKYEKAECQLKEVWDHLQKDESPDKTLQDEVLKMLYTVYDRTANWAGMKEVLGHYYRDNCKSGNNSAISKTMYDLAEACLGNREIKEAEYWCNESIKKANWGKLEGHVLYSRAIDFVARVREAEGRPHQAEATRRSLPAHIQEGSAFSKETDGRLSSMPRHQGPVSHGCRKSRNRNGHGTIARHCFTNPTAVVQ
jgi:hypothetical protein